MLDGRARTVARRGAGECRASSRPHGGGAYGGVATRYTDFQMPLEKVRRFGPEGLDVVE